MNDQVRRKFKISDIDMLLSAGVFILEFCNQKEKFTSYNSVIFYTGYETGLKLMIDSASKLLTDKHYVDKYVLKTQDVKQKLKECCLAYQETKFYMMRAFPNNKAVWAQFGYSDYYKSKYSPLKMGEFMTLLHSASETHKADLINNGYNQVKIDKLLALRDELLEAKKVQLEARKARLALTNQRKTALNQVWDKMREMSEAAEIIFHDDYTKIKLFALPRPQKRNSKKKEAEFVEISGNI